MKAWPKYPPSVTSEEISIDEAIRDLRARIDGELCFKGVDKCEDIKLGIEALRREQHNRSFEQTSIKALLPGERKD